MNPKRGFVARLAAELEAEFQRLGPDTVAAFIAEPVVGATAGCVTAPEGYFRAVREICDRHGALLILDEVMCGMGRTGTLHAWEQEGITPDIQAIAKGLGGGYQPIGAMLATAAHRRRHPRRLRRVPARPHLSGPSRRLRRRAGGAADHRARRTCSTTSRQRGALLEQRLTERFGNHRHVGDIRGRGLFQAVELVADRATRTPFDPALKLNAADQGRCVRARAGCYPMGGTVDGAHRRPRRAGAALHRDAGDIDMIVDRLGHGRRRRH